MKVILLSFFCLTSFGLLWQAHIVSSFAQAPAPEQGVQYQLGTPTDADFDTVNPLTPDIGGGTAANKTELSTPGGIISRILAFAFPLAGIILFVMLAWAGFEILSGAAEKKSLDAGRQRATAAIIGFILLFVSYWLTRIVEVIFGVKIF